MKILLTMPRFEPNTNPPLGIAYIAAFLQKKGIDVEILDPTFENFEFAQKRLEKADFGILGMSVFTMNYNLGRKMAAIAKKANPKLLTVFGGAHPSIVPEDCIKDEEVDAVCIGEGEEAFAEIAEKSGNGESLDGVLGVWFKKDGQIVKNAQRPFIEDLDRLPFPARNLLPMQKYLDAELGRSAWAVKQPSTTITASRGCPYNCTYCSTKLVYGLRVRFRTAKNIADEIESLVKDYGIKGLAFVDDTFTVSKKLVLEIVEELEKRKISLEWACHTRVNTVDAELLQGMKKGGCRLIAMGVESGNQEVLDSLIKKGITLEKVEDAFRLARQAGIITDAYFMIGIPGETKEQMQETIAFARKLNPDVVNFSIARPMPKTEMYDIALKHGEISVSGWDDFDFTAKPIYSCKQWDFEELKKIQKQAYKSFYFRPSYLLKQLLAIRNFSDIKNKLNGLKMVLKT